MAHEAHVRGVGSKFGGELGKTQKALGLVVYGNPDAAAGRAIEGLRPECETPFAGCIRQAAGARRVMGRGCFPGGLVGPARARSA